jgi:hypothetical protein
MALIRQSTFVILAYRLLLYSKEYAHGLQQLLNVVIFAIPSLSHQD